VSGAWARVSALDPDARYIVYASVVDRVTSDPSFVTPVEAGSGAVVIAAAAHVRGLLGTRWRSDVELVNPRGRPATVRVSLLPAGDSCPEATPGVVTVASRAALRLDDVLWSVFGCDGAGAIEIVPVEGEVAVSSRTYHVGDGGTYGQYVPAAGATAALDPGSPGWLPGLRHDRGFRTNLGLVNLSEQALVATVALFAGDGGMVGTVDVAVEARSLRQLNGIIGDLRDRGIGNAHAAVTASGPGLHAWASVIDNRSGDPVFVPARQSPIR
jgi:hypothetical protein